MGRNGEVTFLVIGTWTFDLVRMLNPHRVLPGVEDMVDDFVNANTVLYLCENERAGAAHPFRITRHDIEVCADGLGEVSLVDDKKVALRDSWSAFARNLVAACDVDHLDGVVGEFAAEARGEIVPAGFEQKNVRLKFSMKFLQREEICRNIFSNRGMRAAAGFNGANLVGFKRVVADEELAVFLRKNVVCHRRDLVCLAELAAKLQHESGLAAADGSTNADGKRPPVEVAIQRKIALVKMPGVIHVFVRVSVRTVIVMLMGVHKSSALKES